jgi:hypothetical protein
MPEALDLFGNPIQKQVEETYKSPSISPFDFINAINYSKDHLIVDEWSEKQYNAYIINKGLSFSSDTIVQANEMNSRPHVEKKLQFQFLINTIRSRKRFNKWIKPEKIDDLEMVKEYYGYSTEKARQALSILTPEQITMIKQKLKKGGWDDS